MYYSIIWQENVYICWETLWASVLNRFCFVFFFIDFILFEHSITEMICEWLNQNRNIDFMVANMPVAVGNTKVIFIVLEAWRGCKGQTNKNNQLSLHIVCQDIWFIIYTTVIDTTKQESQLKQMFLPATHALAVRRSSNAFVKLNKAIINLC